MHWSFYHLEIHILNKAYVVNLQDEKIYSEFKIQSHSVTMIIIN